MTSNEFQCIRKIIHIDCDCFYASIEMRDNPALKNLPIAVGGQPSSRGVVATCNYLARQYGIHSAMPMALALKKCPQLIIIKPRMQVYKDVSRHMHHIFKAYTAQIEPLSLDEAFLDVSDCQRYSGSATWIAQKICNEIEKELGITASAGIAPNKLLAKIASDLNKPNGYYVVHPSQVDAFIKPLNVAKIHGVGRVTSQKMLDLGIENCADLQRFTQLDLVNHFGSFGNKLFLYARGIDNREVKTQRMRRSISVENTYHQDIPSLQQCFAQVPELLRNLKQRCSSQSPLPKIKALFVKVKFSNFAQTTAEESVQLDSYIEITIEDIERLIETAFQRKNKAVRLLGVGIRLDPDTQYKPPQLKLF